MCWDGYLRGWQEFRGGFGEFDLCSGSGGVAVEESEGMDDVVIERIAGGVIGVVEKAEVEVEF